MMRKVARNREPVKLASGDVVTLLCWGGLKNGLRARVEFPNGRKRTVKQTDVVSIQDF